MRKHLLWATTAVTITTTIGVMVSDIVFRRDPEVFKAATEAGANPQAWDIVGSIFLFVVWPIVAIDFWRYRWRTQ